MAKKYSQTRKDRRDESRGMERYEEKRKDRGDSGYFSMLSEDRSAPANMPQDVVHKTYPRTKFMDRYEIDDTMKGLDETRDYEIRKMESNPADSRW